MSVTFTKKPYSCTSCGKVDNTLFAIKYNSDITSEYPMLSRPEELKSNGIYEEHILRDDYGIILSRVVKEKPCGVCGSFSLEAIKQDSEDNVLNFFPRTEAHKWLDGLGKAGL